MAAAPDAVVQASGAALLKRAVELDSERRYTEALVFYQSGIQQLMEVLHGLGEENKRQHYRQKISEYMGRAEKIKEHVDKEKEAGKYHEQVKIEANSTGHSYERIFGRFLDGSVTEVWVEDPYVRSFHQVANFVRFCELVVSSETCPNVRMIHLTTGRDGGDQEQDKRLRELAVSLRMHQIDLTLEYSDTLHDREIRFDNGWCVKIGRGLDYFKPSNGKFSIGHFDQNLRHCHETTVDIFHSKHTRHKPNS